jgi:hypothetical protein
MSERKPPAEQPAPSIPDGGLGEAMPEWLRRPPAWRDLEPKAPPRRTLPPPDTSVIDPATLISVDDLPDWLQRLAKPREIPTLTSATPPETPERRVIPRVIEASPRRTPPSPTHAERVESEPAPAARETPAGQVAPTIRDLNLPERVERPHAHSTLVLGTLLGVAVVVIVVLLVLLLS